MSFDDMREERFDLADDMMKRLNSLKLRKRFQTTSDLDLLLKENRKRATKKFIMWMIILVIFAVFIIGGSILLFDELAGLATEVF